MTLPSPMCQTAADGPSLALYQPDMPGNLGTLLRLAACLSVPLEIIEPCGFPLDDRRIRRAGMDYIAHARYRRHATFDDFDACRRRERRRLVLLTTSGSLPYQDLAFRRTDTLLLGRESAGVPPDVHKLADERIVIPLKGQMRSLNIAIAAAMVLGEALRQLGEFARH